MILVKQNYIKSIRYHFHNMINWPVPCVACNYDFYHDNSFYYSVLNSCTEKHVWLLLLHSRYIFNNIWNTHVCFNRLRVKVNKVEPFRDVSVGRRGLFLFFMSIACTDFKYICKVNYFIRAFFKMIFWYDCMMKVKALDEQMSIGLTKLKRIPFTSWGAISFLGWYRIYEYLNICFY